MWNLVIRAWAVVLVAGGCIAAAAQTPGTERSADRILRDIDAAAAPKLDAKKARSTSYLRRFRANQRDVAAKRDRLILELYQTAPDHERLPDLMAERWSRKDERYRGLFKEVDDVAARAKNPKLKAEAIFIKARAKVKETRSNGSPDLAPMEEFLKLSPRDPRGADLLQSAIDHTLNVTAKSALQQRLIKDFPDSTYAAMSRGPREPKEWIGKPFDLEFTDAIAGTPVSIKKLKGKVVVIDFWATWCGPCVAELPKMKELYARFSGQGVEFIGVSLDQPPDEGGLQKLVSFVQENGIAWPQYYQGNGWKSTFSSSWKINSIPRVFVVDPQGQLYSVDARGKLETIIPELLKARLAAAPQEFAVIGD
jgi:thiol-disulfide isomerase/thioredoxin